MFSAFCTTKAFTCFLCRLLTLPPLLLLLLLLSCTTVTGAAEIPPEIGPFFRHLVQPAGSSLLLTCNALRGSRPLYFRWLFNGRQLLPDHGGDFSGQDFGRQNGRQSFESRPSFSHFSLLNLTAADSGNYSCVVENEAGSAVQSSLVEVKSGRFWWIIASFSVYSLPLCGAVSVLIFDFSIFLLKLEVTEVVHFLVGVISVVVYFLYLCVIPHYDLLTFLFLSCALPYHFCFFQQR